MIRIDSDILWCFIFDFQFMDTMTWSPGHLVKIWMDDCTSLRCLRYLLYTTLRDWMFSGRPDAGGQRCEGWALGDLQVDFFCILVDVHQLSYVQDKWRL